MRSKIKRISIVLLTVLATILLCACSTEIDCYYSASGNWLHYRYDVKVSDAELKMIEENSLQKQDGSRWTLGGYISKLCEIAGWTLSITKNNEQTVYGIVAVMPNYDDEEEDSESTVERIVDEGFFFTKVTYRQDHPLASAIASYIGEEPKENTVSYLLKHGDENLPALSSAFPLLSAIPTDIKLSFYWENNQVTSDTGEEIEIDGKSYIKWTAVSDGKEYKLEYSYKIVNPMGWYIVIASIGIASVIVVLIVTAKSKKKPKLVKSEVPQYNNRYEDSKIYYTIPNDNDVFGLDDSQDKEKARKELDNLFGLDNNDDGENK